MASELYQSCPDCGGSGAVTYGDEEEGNCTLCKGKGYALLSDILTHDVLAAADRDRRFAEAVR